ncbi:alpha-glucuronidase family glycosyl hydrolase [Dyadobacter sp. 32]|uniref:alpha-glucuronidase family glycosyl hydrolase n=1 Tax=Dyadobacter sp. 32 TaxID=538966 RepID=UPI0011EECB97
MRPFPQFVIIILSCILLNNQKCHAQAIDLSKAQIFNTVSDKNVQLRTVEILQQEVEKRSGIKMSSLKTLPKKPASLIILAMENDFSKLPQNYRSAVNRLPQIQKEGFKLLALPESNTVLVVGKDARGLLYGTGRLLRNLEIAKGSIRLKSALALATSPRYPIRGHQLGYRPKTNAYDAFTVAQFDQYIRDLALFGANHIEIMPPRTDDDFTSPHMKLPAIKMIVEQSRICKEYGLDVSMWYPNLGKDYVHPDSIRNELKEREEIFSILPKLDAVFVPAGDPGDLEPDVLFAWLEKEAELLKKYHPNAKIWVSPQVFRPTQKWFDTFFGHVNKEYPWFGGVVFGPWIKLPVAKIRELVKPSIPIRHYPDITHNYSSQYPVPHWDLAFAMTSGRESINPRPNDEKAIHNALDQYGIGSISYSEGTNDDVNKFVWSDQDWDPERPVIETLREYARLFIGPDFTESFAQGLLALERNWKGELLTNESIDRTLVQWQQMEKQAPLKVLQNARFQMGLIRAYFDSYTHRRLIYETALEQEAKEILENAKSGTTLESISKAKLILEKAWTKTILPDYQAKCHALADSLYKSIGAQLTMKKHGAMSGRGNFIDLINMPLNDSPWLLDQFEKMEKMSSEQDRLTYLQTILHRTDPGPGGFYDHFGDPESWYRVVPGQPWEKDPGSLLSPRIGFGVGLVGEEWVDEIKATGFKGQVTPRVWMKQAKTLYDQPLKIHYDDLDPEASYTIRIAYTGRFRSRMKMTTDDGVLIHDFIKTGEKPIYEFELPKVAIKKGKVTFVWSCGEGERGSQVTEIWLIRK